MSAFGRGLGHNVASGRGRGCGRGDFLPVVAAGGCGRGDFLSAVKAEIGTSPGVKRKFEDADDAEPWRQAPWRLALSSASVSTSPAWVRIRGGYRMTDKGDAMSNTAELAAREQLLRWVRGASPVTSLSWPQLERRLCDVWLVHCDAAEAAFHHRYSQLACRYADIKDPESPFRPLWRTLRFEQHFGPFGRDVVQSEEELAWREQVEKRFRVEFPDLSGSKSPPVRVQLAFQAAPDMHVAQSILEGGFAELSTNTAVYGLGAYFSMDLPYVLSRYPGAGADGLKTVIVCAVAYGNPYPVIEAPDDARTLRLRPCVARHDAHAVAVDTSQDPPVPMPPRQWPVVAPASELVVFDKAQVLPLGVLRFVEQATGAAGRRAAGGEGPPDTGASPAWAPSAPKYASVKQESALTSTPTPKYASVKREAGAASRPPFTPAPKYASVKREW